MINKLLSLMNAGTPLECHQYCNEEDGEAYHVWEIILPDKRGVLKKAKGYELENYKTFLRSSPAYAPQIYGDAQFNGENYFLMEYISGHDLKRCTRGDLELALDAIIAMQKEFWMPRNLNGYSFKGCFEQRQNRRDYLRDPLLEKTYDAYLEGFSAMPKSLCHDDLLPFNVIVSDDRAVLIDWEVLGVLPYPTMVARLLAHGEQNENAFFYLKQEDRDWAIEYYFQKFASEMDIARDRFDQDMRLCFFYEYCEWVYVGNKYGTTDTERFKTYYNKARKCAQELERC